MWATWLQVRGAYSASPPSGLHTGQGWWRQLPLGGGLGRPQVGLHMCQGGDRRSAGSRAPQPAACSQCRWSNFPTGKQPRAGPLCLLPFQGSKLQSGLLGEEQLHREQGRRRHATFSVSSEPTNRRPLGMLHPAERLGSSAALLLTQDPHAVRPGGSRTGALPACGRPTRRAGLADSREVRQQMED